MQSSLGGVARTKVLALLAAGMSLIGIVLGFLDLFTVITAALSLSLAVRWQGLSALEWIWRALGYAARSRITALQVSSSTGQGTITWRGHRSFQWWSSAHRGRLDLRGRDQQEWSDVVAAMARMSLHGAHHWTWHAASGGAWLSGPAGALLPPTWQAATPHTSAVMPATGWLYETWSYLRGPHGFMSAWRLQDDSSFAGYLADLAQLDDVALNVSATVLNSHASRRRVRRMRHASVVDSAWR